jgi:hypothetical protein
MDFNAAVRPHRASPHSLRLEITILGRKSENSFEIEVE